MKYNLFLDDFRTPQDAFYYTKKSFFNLKDWVIVRSYDVFVSYIKEYGLPEFISFDHDLMDSHYDYQTVNVDYSVLEKTGYHCVKWLVDYCIDNNLTFPEYYVHSMNVEGKKNIISYIENYKKSLV